MVANTTIYGKNASVRTSVHSPTRCASTLEFRRRRSTMNLSPHSEVHNRSASMPPKRSATCPFPPAPSEVEQSSLTSRADIRRAIFRKARTSIQNKLAETCITLGRFKEICRAINQAVHEVIVEEHVISLWQEAAFSTNKDAQQEAQCAMISNEFLLVEFEHLAASLKQLFNAVSDEAVRDAMQIVQTRSTQLLALLRAVSLDVRALEGLGSIFDDQMASMQKLLMIINPDMLGKINSTMGCSDNAISCHSTHRNSWIPVVEHCLRQLGILKDTLIKLDVSSSREDVVFCKDSFGARNASIGEELRRSYNAMPINGSIPVCSVPSCTLLDTASEKDAALTVRCVSRKDSFDSQSTIDDEPRSVQNMRLEDDATSLRCEINCMPVDPSCAENLSDTRSQHDVNTTSDEPSTFTKPLGTSCETQLVRTPCAPTTMPPCRTSGSTNVASVASSTRHISFAEDKLYMNLPRSGDVAHMIQMPTPSLNAPQASLGRTDHDEENEAGAESGREGMGLVPTARAPSIDTKVSPGVSPLEEKNVLEAQTIFEYVPFTMPLIQLAAPPHGAAVNEKWSKLEVCANLDGTVESFDMEMFHDAKADDQADLYETHCSPRRCCSDKSKSYGLEEDERDLFADVAEVLHSAVVDDQANRNQAQCGPRRHCSGRFQSYDLEDVERDLLADIVTGQHGGRREPTALIGMSCVHSPAMPDSAHGLARKRSQPISLSPDEKFKLPTLPAREKSRPKPDTLKRHRKHSVSDSNTPEQTFTAVQSHERCRVWLVDTYHHHSARRRVQKTPLDLPTLVDRPRKPLKIGRHTSVGCRSNPIDSSLASGYVSKRCTR